MEPIYYYAESPVKPVSIEKGKRTVFIRKDFVEKERINDSGETVYYWAYQEARMTYSDFNDYSQFVITQNAINGAIDSENIALLITGQEIGDNNQLIIMEAIADLYDAIASII